MDALREVLYVWFLIGVAACIECFFVFDKCVDGVVGLWTGLGSLAAGEVDGFSGVGEGKDSRDGDDEFHDWILI